MKAHRSKLTITLQIMFRSNKGIFLSNSENKQANKQALIRLLSYELAKNNIQAIQSAGDADTVIAKTAVRLSEDSYVTVVGEDTDILVLLLFHSPSTSRIIYRSDKNSKCPQRCWDIQKTQHVLGQNLLKVLPVIYALTGCDTTSRIFDIGKAAAMKKVSENSYIHDECSVFIQENAEPQHIIESGEKILVALYGGSSVERIDTLRYRKWASKIMSNTFNVQVNTLPPTPDAAKNHSLRTYHQIREWVHTDLYTDPVNWGWTLQDDKLYPVKMHSPMAPETLLKVVRCRCKLSCDSKRCSCRRCGLTCTIACSECRGTNCTTAQSIDDIED